MTRRITRALPTREFLNVKVTRRHSNYLHPNLTFFFLFFLFFFFSWQDNSPFFLRGRGSHPHCYRLAFPSMMAPKVVITGSPTCPDMIENCVTLLLQLLLRNSTSFKAGDISNTRKLVKFHAQTVTFSPEKPLP